VRAVTVPVGGANFGSLRRACERVGVTPEFSDDPLRIANATHVILPGVGAAAPGMERLNAAGLVGLIPTLTQPVLGICLGMQLLFERSDEGEGELLGILPGPVQRLAPAPTWPHMGWNTLVRRRPTPALIDGIDTGDWFYFVHGYAAPLVDATVASAEFGIAFSAVVARDNVFGVQFHPEKSAASGRRLLRNFFST
jgi:glutamine amidotransferase